MSQNGGRDHASADDERLRAYAEALADAVDRALPGWTVRVVEARCAGAGITVDDDVHHRAEAAGEQVRVEASSAVRTLLRRDVDDQPTTPLALLRGAVAAPTRLLRELGVPPVERDEFESASFPDDVYGLSPQNFADIDPALHEPGLQWGAAKAYVILARRRAEGRR